MERYEYKVIPAPDRGQKAKGVKAPADRFAHALEVAMNELGADGWEYWRAECLPSVERQGLTGSRTVERYMLVFRRRKVSAMRPVREAEPAPQAETRPEPVPDPAPQPIREKAPVFTRRLELAREQRQTALQNEDAEDGGHTTPHIRPVSDD
ncbi:DUF4177 domain-containing protein [Rhodobacterales bacterium HKCCE3408]|nr:DUF4177 domain-containing protein [Rhodobacterales bacterium HKCCE3408]